MPRSHSLVLEATPGPKVSLRQASANYAPGRQAFSLPGSLICLSRISQLLLPSFGRLLWLSWAGQPPAASFCPPPAGARPPVCLILPPLKLRQNTRDDPAGSCASSSFGGLPRAARPGTWRRWRHFYVPLLCSEFFLILSATDSRKKRVTCIP